MYVAFNLYSRHLIPDHSCLEQADLRHCTEPSAEPPSQHPTISITQCFSYTHNTAGVLIIVACTKEYSIDGLVGGNGVSRVGGMVKGREDTENNLLETCL